MLLANVISFLISIILQGKNKIQTILVLNNNIIY